MTQSDDTRAEACGRCAMTSVTGMTQSDADGDGESSGRDPFGDARIEVDEDEMRRASPHVRALGRVKRKLDELATRLTYGN